MAYLTHSFGAISFIMMEGEVVLPRKQNQVITRPGVQGVNIRITGGTQGVPFSLNAWQTAATETEANDNFQTLVDMLDDSPATLVKDGVDFSTAPYSTSFKLIDVMLRRVIKGALATGNLQTAGDTVLVHYELVLIATG